MQAFPEACRCHDDCGLNPRCPVHGNHPSSIVPEHDPGECDNTRGYSPEGEGSGHG